MSEAVQLPKAAEYRELILTALQDLGGRASRDALTSRALELGHFTEAQLAVPPPPSHPQYASQIAYRFSWAMTDLKRAGRIENPERSVWALPAPAAPVTNSGVDVGACRLVDLAAMPYREYLRTPEWQRRREEALQRAGHRCQLNTRHTDNLEVHHNTYERRGNEAPGDLIVLCDQCHARHHGKRRRQAVPTPVQSASPPVPVVTPPPRRQRRALLAAMTVGLIGFVGAGAALTTAEPSRTSTNTLDCSDVSPSEAQRLVREDPTDPNGIDRDGDGRACESRR
jgi:hypothetical protein